MESEEKSGNGEGLGLDFKCMNYTTFIPKLDSNSIRNVESCLTPYHSTGVNLKSNVSLSLFYFILLFLNIFSLPKQTPELDHLINKVWF